jgi:hypothetical protein
MVSFTRPLPEQACPRCNMPGAIAPRDVSVWVLASVVLIALAYVVAGLIWVGGGWGFAVTAFTVFSLTFMLWRSLIRGRVRCLSCGARRSWRGRWLP